jgi:hypothetical protein
VPPPYAVFKAFYDEAVAQHLFILVAFGKGKSLTDPDLASDGQNARYQPTRTEYLRAIKCFSTAFPGISAYSAWNEPNNKDQPFKAFKRLGADGKKHYDFSRADRAALFTYYVRTRVCLTSCSVVAGDVIEGGSWQKWLRRYRNSLNHWVRKWRTRYPHVQMPTRWGFHPYLDVEKKQTTGTAAFFDFMRGFVPGGKVWFTEVGGHYHDPTYPDGTQPADDARQCDQVKFLFTSLANYGPGVERLYYYHYWEPNPSKAVMTWDSGLADQGANLDTIGRLRPSYSIVQHRGNAACP